MASLHVRPSALSHRGSSSTTPGSSTSKLSKPRGRPVVKPLLKKLHSHDRESLDLDRDWDDQPSQDLHSRASYDLPASPHYPYFGSSSVTRSPRDASFALTSSDFGAAVAATAAGAPAGGVTPGGGRIHKFSHARSASAASHVSIATSNSGGARNGGSFVHPFQQTPQMPLAYAHSRTSLDARDCSPTITEDDDDVGPYTSVRSASASAFRSPISQQHQQRRPSLASQPASSLSDGTQTLRAGASRSNSGSVPGLACSSANQSRSDLQLSAGGSLVDSPLSTTAPSGIAGTSASPLIVTAVPSCSSSAGPISPIRSSLDMNGFRLRSRSELDTAAHQEQVREARRKFEAKERAKEEKYARELSRKRERATSKEIQRVDREQARLRRTSHASLSSTAASNGPRRRVVADGLGLGIGEVDEKSAFASRHDDSSTAGQTTQATAEDVKFKSAKRSKTAKHRTMGVWTAFVLWLRTRLIKLGRR
ncbi:hypothetical protein HIM_03089 [Hirsutella minnesotensis 3608]|nr:hypothetical protein HIM_03089 [Hirsutella minnesotensis 3608]